MAIAYAYRLAPSGIDRVAELLEENQIAIGWSNLDRETVLGSSATIQKIKEQIADYYPELDARKRTTYGANQVWRFAKVLEIGDVIVVPHHGLAHILRIASDAFYLPQKVESDTAFRRNVTKLKTIKISELPTPVSKKLGFRGHASISLASAADDALEYLGFDPAVITEEREAAKADRLLREAMGSYTVPAKEAVVVERRHAEVSDALIRHLQKKGLKVANTSTLGLIPDLYTLCLSEPMMFEIKTSNGSGDYLKGLGQLLFYEKQKKRVFRKFLVVPPGLKAEARMIFSAFDIGIIQYTVASESYDFEWPSAP